MATGNAQDLNRTHADYTETADVRTKSRDLYEGDEAVKAKTTTYLFQETNETADEYAHRHKRATVDPYVEKIVTARQALLFRNAHTRELPANLERFRKDVDRRGTPANVFFANVAREAQIDGIHWVGVDMTRLPAGGYPSLAVEEAAGHRPFFESIPGANVLDWAVGDDQQLLWAVVKQNHLTVDGPGYELETEDEWKVWTRDTWQLYQYSSDVNAGQGGYTLTDEGENPTGIVPLVPFFGVKNTDYSGWPVCRNVLGYIVLLYNKASDLDWFERVSSHPIPYVISPRKPAKLDSGRGTWIESDANTPRIEIGYLETSGTAFSSLRESIRELRGKIFSVALAAAQRESAQVQSGDAQREDRRIFSAALMEVSQLLESSETRCWKLMAKWTGADTAGLEISYNRDFDDKTIETQMVQTLSSLASANQLTTATLLEILKDGEVLPENIDLEKEVRDLERNDAEGAANALRAMKSSANTEGLTGGP